VTVVFHHAAGPDLTARLLALDGLAALMREAEVLWHVLKPVTAAHIAAACGCG
jgi:hypothetical protein